MNHLSLIQIVIFTGMFFASCKYESQEIIYHNDFDYINEYHEMIRTNHVLKQIEYKFEEEGLDKLKFINKIKYYDENGLCIMLIEPVYEQNPLWNPFEATDSLNHCSRIDKLTGEYDSTMYFYNDMNRLIRISEKKRKFEPCITEINYDDHLNMTSQCTSCDVTPTICRHYEYSYSKDGRIISRKDTFDNLLRKGSSYVEDFSMPLIYKYDSIGRNIFDGNKYTYDEKGNEVEFIPFYSKGIGWKRKFDIHKRKIEEDVIWVVFSTNECTIDPGRYYYKYNANGLLIERTRIVNRNVLSELYKYEYEFK